MEICNAADGAGGMKGTSNTAGSGQVPHTSTTRERPDIQCLGTTDFIIDITHWTGLLLPVTNTTQTV